MIKVFLDTNILVDLQENRLESARAAVIHQLGEDGKIKLYASYLSYANLGYIWRKVPQHERYERIRQLCIGVEILPMDVNQLHSALNMEVKDYEDMLQYQCAIAGGCDVIVTNNIHDFAEFSKIPFMSSRDFLLQYFSTH